MVTRGPQVYPSNLANKVKGMEFYSEVKQPVKYNPRFQQILVEIKEDNKGMEFYIGSR